MPRSIPHSHPPASLPASRRESRGDPPAPPSSIRKVLSLDSRSPVRKFCSAAAFRTTFLPSSKGILPLPTHVTCEWRSVTMGPGYRYGREYPLDCSVISRWRVAARLGAQRPTRGSSAGGKAPRTRTRTPGCGATRPARFLMLRGRWGCGGWVLERGGGG